MTGFNSKREAAKDKLQEPVVQPAQEPVELLLQLRSALALASAICDAVPNRESGHLGTLVNAQPDGSHGYRQIQEAEAALVKYLETPTVTPPLPAQEPVAWKTMEAKYPSLEKLDIRMGDGSILCDVWPQSDGDFWWAGSGTGEKFIDPKYADVTHWRVHSDTTAPQREWVGLTDEEVHALWMTGEANISEEAHSVTAYEVEAKLKERNHGT